MDCPRCGGSCRCGGSMVGKRPNAKACCGACKKRAQRGNVVSLAAVPDPAGETGTAAGTETGTALDLLGSVERRLAAAGRLDSELGQLALSLALMIATGRNTGAAVASLSKELRATLTDALRGAEVEESALDRVRRLRADRLADWGT